MKEGLYRKFITRRKPRVPISISLKTIFALVKLKTEEILGKVKGNVIRMGNIVSQDN